MPKKSRYHYRKRHKPGTAPGTLSAEQGAPKPVIQIFGYGAADFSELTVASADDITQYLGKWPVIWVNVGGLGDVATIAKIGEIFSLHPLALEDTMNVHQRPKTEDYGSNSYTVCRMVNNRDFNDLDLEQISIFVGKNFVISFQERPGDSWDPIRDRIRRGAGRKIREGQADYLAYCLLDAAIDDYFPLLEIFGDHLDKLEESVIDRPDKNLLSQIQSSKRTMYTIRHAIWPMREALAQLMNCDQIVQPETKIFMRDAQDHVIQVLDIVENYRERVSGLMDIYISTLSARMNEVMKVLAIITTIFMPLTFIAGIYGMNFEHMPELSMKYAYPVTLGVMVFLAVVMVVLFWRMGWLQRDDLKPDRAAPLSDKA